MSKTNQSKKCADPTTENKKIESGKAEKKNILEQFVKSKGTVTTF